MHFIRKVNVTQSYINSGYEIHRTHWFAYSLEKLNFLAGVIRCVCGHIYGLRRRTNKHNSRNTYACSRRRHVKWRASVSLNIHKCIPICPHHYSKSCTLLSGNNVNIIHSIIFTNVYRNV